MPLRLHFKAGPVLRTLPKPAVIVQRFDIGVCAELPGGRKAANRTQSSARLL